MINLTDAAKAELEKFFEVQAKAPVRICVQEDEDGRQFLGMLLDEEDPADDKVFEVEGYRFLVESALVEALEAIRVDVVEGDFEISFKSVGQAGCGCGCGGGGGGCGEGEAECGDDCDCSASASCGCGHAH